MKMKKILLLAGLLVLAACAQTAGEPLRLTPEDDGSSVEVPAGQTFEVVLPGNPTTGFTWEVEEMDASLLRLAGEPTFDAESDLLGAGGEMTLRFQALQAGESPLRLIYHQPFEEGVAPEATFGVTVMVR